MDRLSKEDLDEILNGAHLFTEEQLFETVFDLLRHIDTLEDDLKERDQRIKYYRIMDAMMRREDVQGQLQTISDIIDDEAGRLLGSILDDVKNLEHTREALRVIRNMCDDYAGLDGIAVAIDAVARDALELGENNGRAEGDASSGDQDSNP